MYVLPYLAFAKIREAAKFGDVDALAELIDFPSVRDSLKETIRAKLAQMMIKEDGSEDLRKLISEDKIDKFIDAAVTPSGIISFTKGKDFTEVILAPTQHPESPRSFLEQQKDETRREEVAIESYMQYEGLSKFQIRFKQAKQNEDDIVIVMRRNWLSWKVSALRMPLLLDERFSLRK